MRNKIVDMAPFGPVYARKIDVYRERNELDPEWVKWTYVWSTNAHRTCKDAILAAMLKHPGVKFRANFENRY